MGYRVEIDKNSCQSSGNCVEAEPGGFGWDEDDLGEVLPGASRLPLDRLVAAAKHCPAFAIAIYEESGRQIESED